MEVPTTQEKDTWVGPRMQTEDVHTVESVTVSTREMEPLYEAGTTYPRRSVHRTTAIAIPTIAVSRRVRFKDSFPDSSSGGLKLPTSNLTPG